MRQTVSRRHAIAGLGLLGTGAFVPPSFAQDPVPPPPCEGGGLPHRLPGTVPLLPGQFARISVVHHPDVNQVPPQPCIIVADLVGPGGQSLASRTFTDPGPFEAKFFDVAHPGKPWPARVEVFALIRYTPGQAIGSSLQIVQQLSGETVIPVSPCNLPDPTLGGQLPSLEAPSDASGTIGLVRGQRLRLSLVHHEHGAIPPSPCNLVGEVRDARGAILGQETFSDLGHHEAVFLDFVHPGGLALRRDTRMEVSVHVRHTPGHHIGATLQLVNLLTGSTLLPPPPRLVPDPGL